MEKKKSVVSYESLNPEVLEAIKKKYPNGWADFVIKVPKPNNEFFYAITVDLDEASYLVKVPVKVDTKIDTEKDLFPIEAEHDGDDEHESDSKEADAEEVAEPGED
jgi:hypothetical protein